MEKIRYRQLSEVAFSDTDASGCTHFSKILSYVENAEHGFFSSIGIPVFDPAQGGWPRAHVRCDYRRPLRFQDTFEVRLSLSKVGTTSIHWQFEIVKSDTTLAAEGEMVSVKVDSTGTPFAITEAERTKLLSE